ncbi:MAG TPA: hypothetical protein VMU81_09685 [Acetobacteraceae bacterium]|nr:hypothetical protein [Acetobacteraceae bacterium]
MYRWKQHPETVSVRAFAVSVAWILALLGGYWLLAEWNQVPALASALLPFWH